MHMLERRRRGERSEEDTEWRDLDGVLARSAIYYELEASHPDMADEYWRFVERHYVQELGWNSDELAHFAWEADENLRKLEAQRKRLEVILRV